MDKPSAVELAIVVVVAATASVVVTLANLATKCDAEDTVVVGRLFDSDELPTKLDNSVAAAVVAIVANALVLVVASNVDGVVDGVVRINLML